VISLVVCTFNPDLDLLKRALDSAVGFDEVILVDDGSIIKIPRHKNVTKVLRIKENSGLGNARNMGVSVAKGDTIALLDDDDYFGDLTGMFEFVKGEGDIFHFTIQCSDGNKWGQNNVETIEIEDCIPGTSWFKRRVWEQNPYKSIVAEDWVFWCEAKRDGFKFSYFPQIFYNYTLRPESLSHQNAGRLDEARKYINENCINR